MKINNRQLIELLGLSAIVASLIFVGFELKQSRIESENNRSLMREELTAAIYSEVSENSDIWAKGNRGDTLSEEESVI